MPAVAVLVDWAVSAAVLVAAAESALLVAQPSRVDAMTLPKSALASSAASGVSVPAWLADEVAALARGLELPLAACARRVWTEGPADCCPEPAPRVCAEGAPFCVEPEALAGASVPRELPEFALPP